MNVGELKEYLKDFPNDAEVLSCKSIDGCWTVLSKPCLTKYEKLNICLLKEGY